jgi:hypothetical protein
MHASSLSIQHQESNNRFQFHYLFRQDGGGGEYPATIIGGNITFGLDHNDDAELFSLRQSLIAEFDGDNDEESMVSTLLSKNDIRLADKQAIENVHGILKLFNDSAPIFRQSRTVVSPHHSDNYDEIQQLSSASSALDHQLVAAKSVEGILCNFLTRQRNDQQMMIHSQTLEDLEYLIWKCREFEIVPTHRSLQALWDLQQEVYERECDKYDDSDRFQNQISQKHVERSIQLLIHWISLAKLYSSRIKSPPPLYIEKIFYAARDGEVTMTNEMWRLYEAFVETQTNNLDYIPRDYFSAVLQILSVSQNEWMVRQTIILQQLQNIYSSTSSQIYNPTISELESSLKVASDNGWSQEATWLYNNLQDREDSRNDVPSRYLDLWFEAICNDVDKEGSLVYLEMLLLHSDLEISKRLQSRYYFNKYLHKLARTGNADAGVRAEAFFLQWKSMMNNANTVGGEGMYPDEESIHSVVFAYMQGEAPKEVQLSQAERFLQEHKISRR